mgnify:CR=1 FL=1
MYLALALAFALLVAVFAVQNVEVVNVRFFSYQFETPLVLIILGSAAGGAVIVGVLGLVKQIGMSFRLWEGQSRLKRLEGEIKTLKDKEEKLTGELAQARERIEALEAENQNLEQALARLGEERETILEGADEAARS